MIIDTVIMVNNIKDPMGITIVPAIYGISCYVQWRSHIGTEGGQGPPSPGQIFEKKIKIRTSSNLLLKIYCKNIVEIAFKLSSSTR